MFCTKLQQSVLKQGPAKFERCFVLCCVAISEKMLQNFPIRFISSDSGINICRDTDKILAEKNVKFNVQMAMWCSKWMQWWLSTRLPRHRGCHLQYSLVLQAVHTLFLAHR